ncbi:uncharacterized protein C05D11.1-like [Onthophagus taurus]|uniref:uncharacterized protein C05D11.1-like n=1 Tax=Onthophagus taurus TaxID=166361 RepID=UPI000C209477|nr:uncharacterized protein C05D11.1-like [Onthophagus taurus]
MPPVDSTPDINTANFELVYSLQAFNKVPVYEYKSKRTGLTIVLSEVDGPVVNGFFCLATEAHDDDGLPHTLEHLIFLGSEDYPYKGVLDLLANRCLASGTNAWTDIDHTCYTMETAGSEGFLMLMPIFLDHILYPILSDEGFITEVHHITGEGDDGGVVYCEMQGRENSAESRLHLAMARAIYPGKCGYSSETGGILKNLRESCNNAKVRNYHKEFYRPENLRIIITGKVKAQDVFNSLEKLEEKILSKGERSSFTRPWQTPVPPLESSQDITLKYPSDDECNGIFSAAWRGPSSVNEQYTLNASSVLLKYMTDFAVSTLQKEFVEIPDPYASKVVYSLTENSETCLYLIFENVPCDKLPNIKPKLVEIFNNIYKNDDIDMERMKNIINRQKLESLSNMENNPHHAIAFMVIGQMLYGNTKKDLEQRLNPLEDLDKMLTEPKSYWLSLLKRYLIDNHVITIQGYPSQSEQASMAAQEKARIEEQIKNLGEKGLEEKEKELNDAIAFNEKPAPESMLTQVNVPSINSIFFHDIVRYSSDEKSPEIDLTQTDIFTYFDNVKTDFVYIFALLDTSKLKPEQKLYLSLLLEAFFETPIERENKLISYEDVVTELNSDTVSSSGSIGLTSSGISRFRCGMYSTTATVMLQVEKGKYAKGMEWLKEILYKTVFTSERLKIIATKIVNDVAQAKRSGKNVVSYIMRGLCYVQDSNQQATGILRQHKFLSNLLKLLDSDQSNQVINEITKVRDIITSPENVVLYLAGKIDQIEDPVGPLIKFVPDNIKAQRSKSLNVTPDYKLLNHMNNEGVSSCIVGMGCLESAFFYHTAPGLNSYKDDDLPALMLYLQYLIQAEGPMWRQIRGKGLSYGYTITQKINEGLLCLIFSKATNVVGAYKETYEIITKQLKEKTWDTTQLESAKSSLLFEIIEEEKTIGNVVCLSLNSYFHGVDYKHNRNLLALLETVTIEDLNRVGDKYVSLLFDESKTKTAVVCDPAKAEEIQAGFKKLNLDLKVYSSLEESFLNC